jgi:hypothetical protein
MMMTVSIIPMNRLISLREMIDLSDTGNILLQSNMHIIKFRNILLEKIRAGQAQDIHIHVRLNMGQALQDELALYEELVASGAHITVWATASEFKLMERKLNAVIISPSSPIVEESFIIITTGYDGRALITWTPDDPAPHTTVSNIRGVLITNPDETKRLLAKIDALVQKREA